MSQGKDADPRAAVLSPEQPGRVQGFSLEPGSKGRSGNDGVEGHRQLHALLGRVERVQIKHPQLTHGRLLDGADQRRHIERLPLQPGTLDDVGQQDVLARPHRVGLYPDQRQEGRDGALNLFLQSLPILLPVQLGGRSEGLENRDREASLAAGSVDVELGRRSQPGNPLGALPPPGQTFPPRFGHLLCVRIQRQVPPLGLIGAEPGAKVGRAQFGEGEQQVGEISLGVNHYPRDAVQGGLLQEANPQASLSASGHAHADGVSGQVAGLQQNRRSGVSLR